MGGDFGAGAEPHIAHALHMVQQLDHADGARRAADQYYVQKAYPAFVNVVKRVFGYRGRTPPPPDPDRVL